MLQIETLHEVEDNGNEQVYEEPDGDYLDFVNRGNNTITVLTSLESGKGGGETVESPFDPSSETVKGVESSLNGDHSEAELAALLEAEKEGKNRATAKAAIKEKMS